MRILYGVSGEGMGHASLASEIARYLEERGHRVKIVTYGRSVEFLKDFDVFPVYGLNAFYRNGRVRYLKSIIYNVITFPKNLRKRKELKKMVDEFQPDVCLTDEEPIVNRIAYSKKLPLVSSSAVNSFLYCDKNSSRSKKLSRFLTKIVTKGITPKADRVIAISLSEELGEIGGAFIVPPVLRSDVLKLRPKRKKKILVYLAKSNEKLLEILKELGEDFFVYGFGKRKKERNLTFRTHNNFLKDLESCKAVVCTAGFSMISECIHLGKPCFAVPLVGQYEQYYNARFVRERGFGDFSEKPSVEKLRKFLDNVDCFKEVGKKSGRSNSLKALKVIENSLKEVVKCD